jgi:hypothetical protein
MTPALQHLINTRAHPSEFHRQALQDGYLPMRGYGFLKCLQGETTIQEVLSVTASERSFAEAKPTLKPNAPASRALVAAAP